MNILELREKVKLLPQKSGCYIMKDSTGKVIYVGKAKRLRNRVKSYFDESGKTQKTYALVKNIDNFEYIITNSELDAFSLENNLIKKYQPKYNILLKDDKAFPYIKIDMAEKFPRVQVVRRPKPDGSFLFGPYVTGIPISSLMQIIKSAFPVRWCNKNFSKTKLPCKACLHGQIGQCYAPCQNQNEEEYKQIVLKVVDFLNGNTKQVREQLENKMNKFAQEENYEEALVMRDALVLLDKMESKIITSLTTDKSLDIFAFYESQEDEMSVVNVMNVRAGQVQGQTNYALSGVVGSESEILASFIVEYYSDKINLPNEIVCKGLDEDSASLVQMYLLEKYNKVIKITNPQKAIKQKLWQSCLDNAQEYAERSSEANERKHNLTSGAIQELCALLNIEKANRIEGYDISNISGTNNVASMVVFVDGEPYKKDYRKFKIKTVDGANDFACMQEVLNRRLVHLANQDNGFDQKPDVILIDGGLGQLHSASEQAVKLGQNITFISLAKKDEEIYTTTNNIPIKLPKNSYALRLLQRVRDESHRFAVMYHRSVRAGGELKSTLSQIEGIGTVRQQMLYKHFKTIENISGATVEDLAQLDGIGTKYALKIYNYFHE